MSENLIRFSNHIEVFNKDSIAKKWILYSNDEDEKIRLNFGKVIGCMVTNRINSSMKNAKCQDEVPESLQKFVNMIMNNLSNVLSDALEDFNHDLHKTVVIAAKNIAW